MGLVINLPFGTYAKVVPFSGLSVKQFINVGVGVVDGDYCGEVVVAIFDHYTEEFLVRAGDCVTQLILGKIKTPIVRKGKALSDTEGGVGRFGNIGG